jgi:hypothetical protein
MPVCPDCREEFRAGFTLCSDCGATLVDTLPEPVPQGAESGEGSHGGWDQVAESGQLYEAELMAMRIREAGIEAQVVDQTFHAEPLPDVRSFAVVRVLVPSDCVEEARQVLDSQEPLSEDADVGAVPPEEGEPS